METLETCGTCGARLAPDIGWCPRCYAPRAAAQPSGGHAAAPNLRMWYPPEEPTPPAVYSRWRGGATTFGPVGRVVITVAILLVHVLLWKVFGFDGVVFLLGVGYIAWSLLSVWILLHVWKRDRVD